MSAESDEQHWEKLVLVMGMNACAVHTCMLLVSIIEGGGDSTCTEPVRLPIRFQAHFAHNWLALRYIYMYVCEWMECFVKFQKRWGEYR